MRVPISAVIITFNEEQNIERCIRSLEGVADEIIVVDSYSTDKTVEIAASLGAVVYQQVFLGHVEQKNFALSKSTHPQVLSLDADEVLSEKLKESILEVKENWTHDGYYFNRLTSYCGRWIKHTSWYPSKKLRLWDRRKGEWGGVNPHDKFILKKGASRKFLKGDLLHFSYVSSEQHYKKVQFYSRIFAELHFYKGQRTYLWNQFLNPDWRFFRDYIIKLGFLDGRDGYTISRISAYETFLKYSKLLKLQRLNRNIRGDICFFNGNRAWGGGEKWYFDMACRLKNRNYKVVAVANTQSELLVKLRLKSIPTLAINLNNFSFINPVSLFRLYLFFRRSGIKTVLINLSSDLKVAGIAARLAGVKKIIYRRGSAIPVRNTLLNRIIFKYLITDVMANSEETRRTILQNNPNIIDSSKIHIIYNGIDFEDFEKTCYVPVQVPTEGFFIIGNCGRLSPEKGQHHLIELAQMLKEKGVRFKILIAGEGKLKEKLKQLAISKGVEEQVVFLGFMNNLKSFYEKIDLFILTSKWEGFGFVLVEAMSYKKPVVAFDIKSTAEIIVNNQTGFLAENENVQDLYEKTLKIMYDKDLRIRMGEMGKQRVEEMFTMKKALERVEELIGY
jgi:glycosyltransferase involved in cell wall biosynthesis